MAVSFWFLAFTWCGYLSFSAATRPQKHLRIAAATAQFTRHYARTSGVYGGDHYIAIGMKFGNKQNGNYYELALIGRQDGRPAAQLIAYGGFHVNDDRSIVFQAQGGKVTDEYGMLTFLKVGQFMVSDETNTEADFLAANKQYISKDRFEFGIDLKFATRKVADISLQLNKMVYTAFIPRDAPTLEEALHGRHTEKLHPPELLEPPEPNLEANADGEGDGAVDIDAVRAKMERERHERNKKIVLGSQGQ